MMNAADPENITVLEAIDLTIKVDDRILIDRANFSIARGECWALMGPNGIGKSMLIATSASSAKMAMRPPRFWMIFALVISSRIPNDTRKSTALRSTTI